ncbi:MAG: DUF58 domain-containing protein [Gemmatimonadales bacterium]
MSRAAATTGLLDPAVLARIGDLSLIARTVVDGFMHGLHRAPRLGHSTEFAEHRPYQPGDDLRRLDWRVFGRTDRFYIKEYEADTNLSLLLALDISKSMDFGSGAVTKFQYARMLAAALAWFSQRQGDRIGLILYADTVKLYIPPSTRHLSLILHELERARPEGQGGGTEARDSITELLGRTGITTFISDWYATPEFVRQALGQVRVRGHDVIAFHVIDPAERSLPYDQPAAFEDLETGERISVVPDTLRAKYQAAISEHYEQLATELSRVGVDYHQLDSSAPLDFALFQYLQRREALQRVR